MRGKRFIATCLTATLIVAVLPGTGSAAGPYARITGTGSAYAANAVNQWVASGLRQGLQVDYTPTGSAAARADFRSYATDFAVSDTPFRGVDPRTGQRDDAGGRAYTYAPLVADAIAVPYQVRVNGELVRDLRLSGETLARIFTGQITDWSDPRITADNGRQLPSLAITVVVPAEASGASAAFTAYLAKQYPSLWQAFAGSPDWSESYPAAAGFVAVNGSGLVVRTVTDAAGNGAIGFAESTYTVAGNTPAAKLGNAAGQFVGPDPFNVTRSLVRAAVHPDQTANLDGVYTATDPWVYPLSGYTYAIVPTGADDPRMQTRQRQALVDFYAYAVCAGQREVGSIGYAPLPENLVRAGFAQLAKLHDADPAVDLRALDIAECLNPTVDTRTAGVPATAQNDTLPWEGSLSLQVRLGTRVSLTQLDPAAPGGHPAQATDPTGHRHAWVFEGGLDGVAVADTRPAQPGWIVTGQATPMVNGDTTVEAANLGWSPQLVPAGSDAEGTVTAGATVPPRLQSQPSPGLSSAAVLASTDPGSGLGVQQVGATIRLWLPDTAPKGHYTGTLTLTLISA